jgi:hypothetical protein
MLLFIQVIHSLIFTFGCVLFTSTLYVVNAEGDVVGGPRDLICVPIIGGIKVLDILPPVSEAGPNEICRDFFMLMRLYL